MARTERADTPPFDLRRFLPRRAAEVLGIPGAVAFRPHRELVAERAAHVASVRALSDVELRSAAREASAARRLAALAEAVERAFGHPPYDEQLLAVAALIDGYAVEMDTGEGKTLVGAMTAASHALAGRRVHVLSVNDYLARRDAEWMTPLFDLLGLRVGSVGQTATTAERRDAYAGPIVYAPISEVGYDVLRDRQVSDTAARVAPVFDVAIVDEADAVMIDEAMVPLVLAGTGEKDAQDLLAATEIVADLVDRVHYAIDEDGATVSLTDTGLDRIENRLGGVNLFDLEHSALLTRINLALHARALVHRDVDYLVTDGRIRLVNTARGRIAELQRWPDGLHAAVEAKEGLDVTPPGVILDTITVQDLLLRYRTLSGMSGTILAVAEELMEFYRLRSGRVERHRPGIRVDEPLRVLATSEEKKAAVVAEIARRHAGGQPVLVGTQSIAESEELAGALPAQMQARVLNARNDEQEAALVARAGEVGAVTISTQMSGRGTDIRLGGADEGDRERVVAAGGLVVIATALYPSRRLDQQLRGRAGRQGDPGVSVSFASLHDDLVLQNATRRSLERIERGSLDAGTRVKVAVEAQRIAETVRLGQHRGTWEYTRAITAQREKVLAVRDGVLRGEQKDRLRTLAADEWMTLAREAGEDAVDSAVRLLALYHLDDGWQEHLALLTEVRDGIHLRVLAGQNPAEEFHRIALREFHGFFEAVDAAVARDIRALTADDLDDPLGRLDRRRPSATWTYMVRDDPFGAAGGRAGRLRDALLRRRDG